jgi:hypothetical protein
MHFEILIEDNSGKRLLEHLIKMIVPEPGAHSWRIHPYKGIGRIPRDLVPTADPAKRMLLDQLPRILRGYANSPGIDAVVVVLDVDKRDCRVFLDELRRIADACNFGNKTMFRLAIEEIEAWYLGDRQAIITAYPRAKSQMLSTYEQDSICDTWELLADAIYPGGSGAIKKSGWPLPGQIKHEWAEKISPLMSVEENLSPSFAKLRDGLRKLVARDQSAIESTT